MAIPPELVDLAQITVFVGGVAVLAGILLDYLAYRKQNRAQEHVLHIIELGVQGILGTNTMQTIDEATERRQVAGAIVKKELAK